MRLPLIKEHIEGVDLARIVGALGIVIFHFVCIDGPMPDFLYTSANCRWGQIWVALFFALSGACIARSNTETPVGLFYMKRWMGVFPVFFIAYLVVFAVKLVMHGNWWAGIDWHTFPLTLIGMDTYFYYIKPNFACVGEWFIGALLVCYLLFPLLRKLLQFAPISTALVLLLGCWFIPFWPWFDVHPWRNLWVCITIFYIGMLMAQWPALFKSKISMIVSALLSVVWLIVPLPFKQVVPLMEIFYPILTGITLLVFITQLGAYIERLKLSKNIMPHLGKISYPIFLVQHVVILAVLAQWPIQTLGEGIIVLLMDIVLTFLLADVILTIHGALSARIKNK